MLEVLRERLEMFRRLEAEHRFGVVIGDPVPLPRNPDLPAGLYDAFSLVGRVETGNFRFEPPPEVHTFDAWRDRRLGENCPPGSPPAIGHEIARFGDGDVVTGGEISLDVTDGSVYFIDGDSYAYYLTDGLGEEEIDVEELAPDLPTFFARYVFGPEYPDLVDLVCVYPAHRTRKRRYVDPWMRLLVAAGLVVPPADRRAQ
jgi:hypothetical protein